MGNPAQLLKTAEHLLSNPKAFIEQAGEDAYNDLLSKYNSVKDGYIGNDTSLAATSLVVLAATVADPSKKVKSALGIKAVGRGDSGNSTIDVASLDSKFGQSNLTAKLPEGYKDNGDGTITGSGDGLAKPFLTDLETNQTTYQRIGKDGKPGGFYTIDENGIQQPVANPNPDTSTIKERNQHHQNQVDQIAQDLKNDGQEVRKEGRVYHPDGSGYCKPDICVKRTDGTVSFIEVKTGGADFTKEQRKGIETIKDPNGQERYRIPPTATVDEKLAEFLGLQLGQKIGDEFPNGIEVIKEHRPGISEGR